MQSVNFSKSREFGIRTKNNILGDEILLCKECKKPLRTIGADFCSTKCAAKNTETREKFKQTNVERIGVSHPSKSKKIKEKRKNTFLKKYGCENPMQLESVKHYFAENLNVKQEKEYATKKKNKTFKSSKEETKFFNHFKQLYPDTIAQYKSAEYPGCCDIYIPSKRLFIEIQRSGTHGGRPYVQKDCKKQLEKGEEKAKTSQYYKNAIETGTKRDVEKRNGAKKHQLNYVEIFESYAAFNSSKMDINSGLLDGSLQISST